MNVILLISSSYYYKLLFSGPRTAANASISLPWTAFDIHSAKIDGHGSLQISKRGEVSILCNKLKEPKLAHLFGIECPNGNVAIFPELFVLLIFLKSSWEKNLSFVPQIEST